jgi:hypothetical protein
MMRSSRTATNPITTAEDIAILDEYRTVVNIGMIQDLPKKTQLVEIDRTKAFTAAFMEITKVPVFQ